MNTLDMRIKASQLVDNNNVVLVYHEQNIFHFKILIEGKETNVYYYYSKKYYEWHWSCDNVTKEKDWTCSLFKGDQSKPFCKHSLAAHYFLQEIRKRRY